MKRIVALILAICAMLALVSCGGDDKGSDKELVENAVYEYFTLRWQDKTAQVEENGGLSDAQKEMAAQDPVKIKDIDIEGDHAMVVAEILTISSSGSTELKEGVACEYPAELVIEYSEGYVYLEKVDGTWEIVDIEEK